VAVNQWLRLIDIAGNLADWAGRRRAAGQPPETGLAPGSTGPLAQLETRLAGVLVAALKEAFDRDKARMDLERAHLDAERQRAEEALRAELRRQAAELALGRVRATAMMAIGVWMLSAALAVWMPGMRTGVARYVLGGGWACALASLGCAFAGWQRVATWLAVQGSPGAGSDSRPGPFELAAPWLLVAAVALVGLALLLAI
jgi:hypothetical protein